MQKNTEIVNDIRNKLQTPCLVVERAASGKTVPERVMNLAINDLMEVEKLLAKIEG